MNTRSPLTFLRRSSQAHNAKIGVKAAIPLTKQITSHPRVVAMPSTVQTSKICKHCGLRQPFSEFQARGRRKDGRNGWCRTCLLNAPTKPCTKCRIEKPRSEFLPRNNTGAGLCSWCRDCMKANRDQWWEKIGDIPTYTRQNNLKRYGLTLESYESLLAAQGGVCAICGADKPSKKKKDSMHVDHCHKTGKVRGLLCINCNRGLGHFSDDYALIEKAAAYLKASAA